MTQRVSNRDTILAFFLGGSATIMGIAISSTRLTPLLFVIPVFGMGASLVYAHHTRMIAALGRYLSIELQDTLIGHDMSLGSIRHWDNSLTLVRLKAPYLFRIMTILAIVTVPQIAALVLAGNLVKNAEIKAFGIWGSIVAILISVATQFVVEFGNARHFQRLRRADVSNGEKNAEI
jgi:hypothetical protein